MYFIYSFLALQNAARVGVGVKGSLLRGMPDNTISHTYFIDKNGNAGKLAIKLLDLFDELPHLESEGE